MANNSPLRRRTFIKSIPVAAAGGCLLPTNLSDATIAVAETQDNERPSKVDPALVQEMVGVSHGNIDRMQQLIEKEPTLVNAVVDWGGGDFESALGAAAHTGGRDRATLLLEHGARLNVFAATMLGWLDVIQPIVARQPNIVNTLGPHGITLWSHARFGGEHAAETLAFLETVPGILKDIQMSDDERAARVGQYRGDDGQPFEIVEQFGSLYLRRNESEPIRLVTSAENLFHPIDRLTEEISFDIISNTRVNLTIVTNNSQVHATRVN